jgi:hypothetical protein
VRRRNLRVFRDVPAIALRERARGFREPGRADQPFHLGAHRRRLVLGRGRIGLEEHFEIHDQLGKRMQPRKARVARQERQELLRADDGAALPLLVAAQALDETAMELAQRFGQFFH